MLAVDVLERHAVRAVRERGVVDEDVDPAELGDRGVYHLPDLGLVAGVGHQCESAASLGPDLLGGALDVAPAGLLLVVREGVGVAAGPGDDDIRAAPRESDGGRPPDAAQAARPGDDRNLAVELSHHLSRPCHRRLRSEAAV